MALPCLVRSSVTVSDGLDICSIDCADFPLLYAGSHVVARSLQQWIFVEVLISVQEIDVTFKNYCCV